MKMEKIDNKKENRYVFYDTFKKASGVLTLTAAGIVGTLAATSSNMVLFGVSVATIEIMGVCYKISKTSQFVKETNPTTIDTPAEEIAPVKNEEQPVENKKDLDNIRCPYLNHDGVLAARSITDYPKIRVRKRDRW